MADGVLRNQLRLVYRKLLKNLSLQSRMQKVVVTGAAGLLGSHLVELLMLNGYEVIGVVKKYHDSSYLNKLGVKVVKADLNNPKTYVGAIPVGAIIIHNYALSPGANASRDTYIKENVKATLELLKEAKRKKVKQFIYMSSCSVVGPRANRWKYISERDPPQPDTDYGESKLRCERLVRAFHSKTNIPCLVLRVFPIYGPRCHLNATPIRLYKMLKKKRFIIVGSGGNDYEFCYAANAADGILLAMQKRKTGIHTFNVSETEKRTFKEVVREIAKYSNPQVKYVWMPRIVAYPIAFAGEAMARMFRVRHIIRWRTLTGLLGAWNSDCSKLKSLGYKQRYSLEQGVANMSKWINGSGALEKDWERRYG